jgi:PKD repeat protein
MEARMARVIPGLVASLAIGVVLTAQNAGPVDYTLGSESLQTAAATEQNPQHAYTRGGDFVVTLEVTGPSGTSRLQRVWDVSVR